MISIGFDWLTLADKGIYEAVNDVELVCRVIKLLAVEFLSLDEAPILLEAVVCATDVTQTLFEDLRLLTLATESLFEDGRTYWAHFSISLALRFGLNIKRLKTRGSFWGISVKAR